MNCTINLVWDNEANRWYTKTDDVPGLVLESASFDDLIERVKVSTPEMLKMNLNYNGSVYILFKAERIEKI